MTTARKYVLESQFQGEPKRSDVKIVEEKLPPLNDGEILAEAVWLSVDPYMRPYMRRFKAGDTMIGTQVAKVIESKNEKFAVGDYVVGAFGWRTKTISNGEKLSKLDRSMYTDKKLSSALGVLGMPGATAYFGFLELCTPKAGETLVVSTAAGAVGSIVGQIAKIKGCRVVGFAGSDEKVGYIKGLGFDEAYNYKTITSLKETLQKACPKGIDMFFDNVGGDFYDTVLPLMNEFGRVSICGCISQYNLEKPEQGARLSGTILFKQLKIEGFIVHRWLARWPEAFKEMNGWIEKDQLKYNETVTEGFDNMFDAFAGLFTGKNLGKAVVKA
ncbi:prostaglandin reductase 1-like [Dysidea avara]|uniref:prostaglandin reductase 1-like n=1 Tax=Dysidea avara TaxID=196820 RepID=UPI00331CF2D6